MIFSALSQNNQQGNNGNVQKRLAWYLELFIVGTLSISLTTIFINVPRWTRVFGEAGFVALLLWALYHKRKPVNPIPHFLIIISVLYILSYVVNVFMCLDPNWEHVNIRKYIYIIIGGLLFAFPIKYQYRKFMIITFFSSAAIAGVFGIYQCIKGGIGSRAQGFSGNPLHYAGLLAFVCSAAAILLIIRNKNVFQSKQEVLFLFMVAGLTFLGIIFSQSRGVWVALFVASTLTIFIYDRRKALIFLLCTIVVLSVTFYLDIHLKEKAVSIITSFYTEDENGSTGARIELWKGSLLIFKESPILGVGTENFESNIAKLVHEKKLKETPTEVHAHNIFFQALATRGTVGFIATVGFFIALIKWGMEEIRDHARFGGYIIMLSTLLTVISGLTENNIEFTKFLAAYCFTIGLIGPLGSLKEMPQKTLCYDEEKLKNRP